jgi:hypothetical protein
MKRAIKTAATPASPPTTPPTMAPVRALLFSDDVAAVKVLVFVTVFTETIVVLVASGMVVVAGNVVLYVHGAYSGV